MWGHEGSDRFYPDAGDDYMDGADGRDRFYFHPDRGHDRIREFIARNDRLYMDQEIFDTPPVSGAQVVADDARIVGYDTVLDFCDDSITQLNIIDLSRLADAFVFF